jgi:hypothetical protein
VEGGTSVEESDMAPGADYETSASPSQGSAVSSIELNVTSAPNFDTSSGITDLRENSAEAMRDISHAGWTSSD